MNASGKKKIAVAMSGGVDSTVAALILKEQGWSLIGLTLKMTGDSAECSSETACRNARSAADFLGIEHRVITCPDAFGELVLRHSWNEYFNGRTPNPCVVCNRKIKFGLLLDKAMEMGYPAVATGHYARIIFHPGTNDYRLYRGADRKKDQSYFLFYLSQKQLAHAKFPLGALTKKEIRALAEKYGLPNAKQRESQDACIALTGELFGEILRRKFSVSVPGGMLVDETGKELARHNGLHRFTIGQRRGLGVALGKPAYVIKIDPADRTVMVSTNRNALLARRFRVTGVNWCGEPPETRTFRAEVKIRYMHPAAPATITTGSGGEVQVHFDEPQRAITPGQAAVFYQDQRTLGGGWIQKVQPLHPEDETQWK